MLAGGMLSEIKDDDAEYDNRILDSLPSSQAKSPTCDKVDPLLCKLLQQIEIVGFNMTIVPAITNLTYFMN